VRFSDARRSKGKRGGLRVIYYYWTGGPEFWLFTLYDKDEMADLTPKQTRGVEGAHQRRAESEAQDMRKKRNLFDELMEGFGALADQRAGKRTLRTHAVKPKPVPEIRADELTKVREDMKLSRSLFARYLRTNVRTLENWEQGRAKPNAQAALLIRLVQRYPDTVRRLAEI
jgi:putative transcriptional regulator